MRGKSGEESEWRMANGEWRLANGEWRMANGVWRMANGEFNFYLNENKFFLSMTMATRDEMETELCVCVFVGFVCVCGFLRVYRFNSYTTLFKVFKKQFLLQKDGGRDDEVGSSTKGLQGSRGRRRRRRGIISISRREN